MAHFVIGVCASACVWSCGLSPPDCMWHRNHLEYEIGPVIVGIRRAVGTVTDVLKHRVLAQGERGAAEGVVRRVRLAEGWGGRRHVMGWGCSGHVCLLGGFLSFSLAARWGEFTTLHRYNRRRKWGKCILYCHHMNEGKQKQFSC